MRPIAAAQITIALTFLLLALLLSLDTAVPELMLISAVVGLAIFIMARAVRRNARHDVAEDKPGSAGVIIAVLGTPLMVAHAVSSARVAESGQAAPFLFGFLAFLCLAVGVSSCRYVRATKPVDGRDVGVASGDQLDMQAAPRGHTPLERGQVHDRAG